MIHQTEFRIGDIVVHPSYGLCRISAIEQIEFGEHLERCYVFLLGSARNPTKLFLPITQAREAGLRRPMSKQQAKRVLKIFQSHAEPLGECPKERMTEFLTSLNSDDTLQVAAVARDLIASGMIGWRGDIETIPISRRLSERTQLERTFGQALGRLVAEISFAQGETQRDAEKQIRRCLKQNHKKAKDK